MAIKRFGISFLLVVVLLAKINDSRTFSGRILRLRDEDRGLHNGKPYFWYNSFDNNSIVLYINICFAYL